MLAERRHVDDVACQNLISSNTSELLVAGGKRTIETLRPFQVLDPWHLSGNLEHITNDGFWWRSRRIRKMGFLAPDEYKNDSEAEDKI